MRDLWQFVKSVWKHSVYILTSSAVAALVTLWEHLRGATVSRSLFLAITILLLLWAFFRSWHDEYLNRIKVGSELSEVQIALDAERAKRTLEESEARLAEAHLEEIAAQKKKREAEDQHAERMRFLTAPDTGIRYYVNQVTRARHISTMPFTVEQLVEALSATQSEIEDALLLLRSRGFARETSLPGHWIIH